ncbi:MAG: PUA domain-containing protein [Candidatus Woesearchaeota archaeon]|jgi:PUA domain protein
MRKQLSGSDVKELLEKLPTQLQTFTKKDKVEQFDNIYKLNEKPFLFEKDDKLIPLLKSITNPESYPHAIVDMGAIRFVVGGADIMRPGITQMSNFKKDDYVIIIDQTHKKPLAIGIALFDSDEMKNMKTGKVLKNIHFVGDDLWKIS